MLQEEKFYKLVVDLFSNFRILCPEFDKYMECSIKIIKK